MPHARDFAPRRTGLHVLVIGNVVDGLTFLGPYRTRDDAHAAGERRSDRVGDDAWTVAPLDMADDEGLTDAELTDFADQKHAAQIADEA